MKVCQGVGDIFILPIDGTDSIHNRRAPTAPSLVLQFHPEGTRTELESRPDYFPNKALKPSHTAPTNPDTSTVMTALKV